MQPQTRVKPWWAALIVWGLVNIVNILQSAGFLSRVYTGSMEFNHFLGYFMIALSIPAALTIIAFRRARTGWPQWIGPAVYLIFIMLMIAVDYVWPVEFRHPMRYSVLVPYLLLFFGSILLMGLPMYRSNRRMWLVTVATTVLLIASMTVAMMMGIG